MSSSSSSQPSHDQRMAIGDHLEELRKRIMWGLLGPVIFAVILMFFSETILQILNRPLLQALSSQGLDTKLYTSSPLTALTNYFRISIIGGLVVGLPWIQWQAWQFIAPGLYPKERKLITALIPASYALATAGVLFMYHVMLPFTLWFLVSFTVGYNQPPDIEPNAMIGSQIVLTEEVPIYPEFKTIPMSQKDPVDPKLGQIWVQVPQHELKVYTGVEKNGKKQFFSAKLNQASMLQPLFQLDDYIKMVMMFALGFSVAFQLPLVMLLVAKTGLLNYQIMRKGWRVAAMGSAIAGAILTPQDPWSMLALTIPLYLLYEFGLILVKLFATPHSPVPSTSE